MSEAVNTHQETIKKIPVMALAELQKTIEASTSPIDANDQQKQVERKELQTEAQKRLEVLKQSGTNEQLDLLEQKIKSFQQASVAPAQAPSNVATVPSAPLKPPNLMEKMQFTMIQYATGILQTILPAGMKNQMLDFVAGLNDMTIPYIGKITIPGAEILSDIASLTNVREQMTEFVRQNPRFILDASIDASIWKAYKEHLKKNPTKPIAELLKDFALQAQNIPHTKMYLSLTALLEPKKVLDPMKTAVETSLVSAVQKAWGVKTVEFKDGPPTLRNGTLTVSKADVLITGEARPDSEAATLKKFQRTLGNVDAITLSTTQAINIAWNGEKREITLPADTKEDVQQSLKEILAQTRHERFGKMSIENNDALGSKVATLTFEGKVGTLTAPYNIDMLKALTRFRSLTLNEKGDSTWKLDGVELKLEGPVVNMKKEVAPKVS